MKKWIEEFKEFAIRGNVLDMAIGVIIGSAFSGIVNSLVNDVLMQMFTVILGKHDFTQLVFEIGGTQVNYGNFIQAVINFLFISISVFIFVKFVNKFKKKEEKVEEVVEEPQISSTDALLTEILEELKKQK